MVLRKNKYLKILFPIFLILFAATYLWAEEVVVDGARYELYIVKKGDTIWGIAGKKLKDPYLWRNVWNGNKYIPDPALIYPGQPLLIPASHASETSIPSAAVEAAKEQTEKVIQAEPTQAAIPAETAPTEDVKAADPVQALTDEVIAAIPGVKKVALMDFDNAAGDPDYNWISSAIPGILCVEFKAKSKIGLIGRSHVAASVATLKAAGPGAVNGNDAAQIGKNVGADAVLTGVYHVKGDSVRIDAKIVKVETGEVFNCGSVSGTLQNIFNLEKRLANKVMAAIEEQVKEENPAGGLVKTAPVGEDATYEDKVKLVKQIQRGKNDEEAINHANNWLTDLR